MAATVCLGVAGADGEARGMVAEDVSHGGSLGFGLDPEKRAQGMGRERGGSWASSAGSLIPRELQPAAWSLATSASWRQCQGAQ